VKIVRFLIEDGAEVNARTDRNVTALVLAVQNKHKKTLKLLRGAGATEQ
jgi:ankyrin repeat protein